jgi:D-lactate dehydrogenase
VREGNFSLEKLEGFDLFQKTVGVIGVGKIGKIFINIMKGFGCKVLIYDIVQDPELMQDGIAYVTLNELFTQSDVISLHCPLNAQTQHLINDSTLQLMKAHVYIINTGRGALIQTEDAIKHLKNGKIGGLALDVYEQESAFFFGDHSSEIINDDVLMRLMTFPNVIITSHQGFFTKEALTQIASTTFENLKALHSTGACANEIK